jgi:aminoglycoside/choline kinase family phosphotransferase
MENALANFAPDPTTLALRDYHAENLIWRPEHKGARRVGLLDFQDAFVAPAGYDLASLLRDARRDVASSVANETIDYFATRTKAGPEFRTGLACLGVQRNLRILGVFARLATTMGKPRYLAFMPRVWGHILQDIENPNLTNLKQAVMDTVPAPTPSYLKGLAT